MTKKSPDTIIDEANEIINEMQNKKEKQNMFSKLSNKTIKLSTIIYTICVLGLGAYAGINIKSSIDSQIKYQIEQLTPQANTVPKE